MNDNKEVKKPRTLEETVGKNIMGILASVLIFAGLTLFATAVNEYITDEMKMVVILAISVIMFLVGLVGKQKKHNPFYMSLAGCGIGAIFISIFLAYGYFHIISMLFLYIALGVWAVLVAVLGGEDSVLFRIIGQLGIMAALIFGVTQLFSSNNEEESIIWTAVLILFFIAISIVYLALDHKEGKVSYKVEIITDIIATAFLYFSVSVVSEYWVRFALFVVVSIYGLALLTIYSRTYVDRFTDSVGWLVLVLVDTIIFVFADVILRLYDGDQTWIYSLFGIIYVIGIIIINEVADTAKESKTPVQIIEYVPALIMCYGLGIVSDFIGAGLLVIPLAIIAYKTCNKVYMYLSVMSTVAFVLVNNGLFIRENYIATYILFSLVFIVLNVFVMALRKEDLYDSLLKIFLYFITNAAVICAINMIGDELDISSSICRNWNLICSTVLCLIATFSPFNKDWLSPNKKDRSTMAVLFLVTAVLALNAIGMLYTHNGEVYHVINAILLAVILGMNVKPMADEYGNSNGLCIYNCIKITVFILFTMNSYDAVGYVISAGLLLVAIICIVYGFIKKYKSVRLYGLILSIISIAKIVLFDIEYNSNLSRAITIFGCGIIAFAICLVYNILDKRLDPSEDSIEQKKNNMEPVAANTTAPVNTTSPVNTTAPVNTPATVNMPAGMGKEYGTIGFKETGVLSDEPVISAETITDAPKADNEVNVNSSVNASSTVNTNSSVNINSTANTDNMANTNNMANPVPLYFVQYVIPDQNGKPVTKMIPVYPGQAMMPVNRK